MSEFTYEVLESIDPIGKVNITIKRSDGAFIPTDLGNSDYQAYLEYLATGGSE